MNYEIQEVRRLQNKKYGGDTSNIEKNFYRRREKCGKSGYAIDNYYVEDDVYKKYLQQLQNLIDDKKKFYEIARRTYRELVDGKNE